MCETEEWGQRQLILIKHSMPEIRADVHSEQWRLSEEGRRRCVPLAEKLAAYELSAIVSSTYPRARETADLIAAQLGMHAEMVEGLQENDRTGLGLLPADELVDLIAEFFKRPGRGVMGRETADQARARFTAAVEGVVEQHTEGNLAIVAHGTVITLFVAAHNAIEPFSFWQGLGLPSMVALSLPGCELVETVAEV